MSKTPSYDNKVKQILDSLQPGEQTCKLLGTKWNMDEREIEWYHHFNVPPSGLAPLTRLKTLATYFTNYQWWWHKHPETGKPLLSGQHPASGIKVLPDAEFFSKDFTSAGIDIDLEKPFFEQFVKLVETVPMMATRNFEEPENSIALTSLGDQNSYFVLACRSKNSFFGLNGFDIEDCVLVVYAKNCSRSYNLLRSDRVHNSQVVRHSQDIMDSSFLFDCRNCSYCFGATNKRNKQFLWFNEQLTEAEWKKRRAEVDLGDRRVFDEYFKQFRTLLDGEAVWPENFNIQVENSTGEYLYKVNDCLECFSVQNDATRIHYGFIIPLGSEDIYCSGGMVNSSDLYFTCGGNNAKNCLFSCLVHHSQNMEYCYNCHNCENCFGCVGLNRKKYCIFNTQYSEEEYWSLVDKIKCTMMDRGEYGQYMPASIGGSYVWEGASVPFFMTTKEEADKIGIRDYDPNSMGANGTAVDPATARKPEQLPDLIDDLDPAEWVGKPIWDEEKQRAYAFLEPEIAIYKQLRIPAPKEHFITRLRNIQLEQNTAVFEDVTCFNCSKQIRVAKNHTYKKRKIYCKDCYLQYLETNG